MKILELLHHCEIAGLSCCVPIVKTLYTAQMLKGRSDWHVFPNRVGIYPNGR